MKRTVKLNAVSSALAIAAALAFSGAALADTVVADIGFVSGKSGTINTNQGDGTAGLAKASSQGGTFSGDLSPFGDNAFLAFCLQPGEGLADVTYTVKSLKDAPVTTPGSTMGDTAQKAMEILLGNVFPVFSEAQTVENVTVGALSEKQQFMAVQLAIWEIATERSEDITDYSVTTGSGSFSADSGYNANIVDQANAWLSSLDDAGWESNQLHNLVALVNDGTQDFVAQVVPIPAAAWLFGSALVGAVGLGRRRKDKGEAAAA